MDNTSNAGLFIRDLFHKYELQSQWLSGGDSVTKSKEKKELEEVGKNQPLFAKNAKVDEKPEILVGCFLMLNAEDVKSNIEYCEQTFAHTARHAPHQVKLRAGGPNFAVQGIFSAQSRTCSRKSKARNKACKDQ